MFKVSKEDPRIIARFTDEPMDSATLTFTPQNKAQLQKRWTSLNQFMQNDKVNLFKRLDRLFEFVEMYLREFGVPQKSVCQKGCAHCCFVDVDVSMLEAMYIASRVPGLTVVDRDQRVHNGYEKARQYCPFLDKGTATCTIHAFRPLACRTFFAFDNPKFCADPAIKHALYNSKSSDVLSAVTRQLYTMSQWKHADIREWFAEHTTDPYDNVYASDVKITSISAPASRVPGPEGVKWT